MGEWVGSAWEAGYSKTVVGLIERGWSDGGSLETVKAVEVDVVSEEVAGRACFITAGGAGVCGEVVAAGVRTGHNGRDGFGADLGFCCNRGIFLGDGAWHDGGGEGRDGRTCVGGGGGYSEIEDKL